MAPGTAARRAGDARYPAVTPKAPCAKIPSVIAKTVFQVHAVDADGGTVIRKHLRRAEVLSFLAGLEPCLIGMEACATSHYWGRELAKFGHTVKLMPPAYVKPYVKRGKNDATDAEAICEAVSRPNMRFVPVKSADPQTVLMLHRPRALLIRQQRDYVAWLVRLSYLSPEIVRAILAGQQPVELTPTRLVMLSRNLPYDWQEQRRLLGFAPA